MPRRPLLALEDRPTLGDRVPAALAAYYSRIDAGDFEGALDAFADDGVYAVSPPGGREVDPRLVVDGRSALAAYLAQRGHRRHRHHVLVCVSDGQSCLVEGLADMPDGDLFRTFAVSAQLDTDGLITRYLAYDCEPVSDPLPATGDDSPGDAAAAVDRYFQALDDADFDAAAGCFSEHVVYCHPPYLHGGITEDRRFYFRGRHELLAAFRRRGQTHSLHDVPVSIQRGPNCLFEVVVTRPGGGGGTGVSSLSLDSEGLISRYLAFYTEPVIDRR